MQTCLQFLILRITLLGMFVSLDPVTLSQYIAENLKRLRKEKNLSMQQLANLAEIEKSQVYRIESGKSDARISTLLNIANTLEVDVSELLRKPQ